MFELNFEFSCIRQKRENLLLWTILKGKISSCDFYYNFVNFEQDKLNAIQTL